MAVTTTFSFSSVVAEFGVNQVALRSQTAPALARLTNGELAFVFQSAEATAPNEDLIGRIIAPGGTAVSNDVDVQVGPGDRETAPQIAALNGGNFVVVYSDSAATGSAGGSSTAFRILPPDGASNFAPILVENEDDNQTAPAIAALGTGFVIVHVDQSSGSENSNAITAQRYNGDGTLNGGQIVVAAAGNGSPLRAPKVAALTDGGFVVVWADDVLAGAGENYDIFAQRYTAAGAANGGLITVDSEPDQQSNPVVAALAGGAFAVAWEDEEVGNPATGNIDYASVSNAGVVVVTHSISANGRQDRPAIAALTGAIFVVGYVTSELGDPDIFGIM